MRNKWYRLDTAALIFPTINSNVWSNVFRLSAVLNHQIDVECLQKAVDDLKNRFPFYYVNIQPGFFWYYLQHLTKDIVVQPDYAYPVTTMTKAELRKCCLRVLYYRDRIAVEFFHSVTDGTGAAVYLRSLVSRYIEIKYGVDFTENSNTLKIDGKVMPEDIEDSFHKYSSGYSNIQSEKGAFHYNSGTFTPDYLTLTTAIVSTSAVKDLAHKYNTTITMFLAALLTEVFIEIQKKERALKKQRSVNISIPINLRKIYQSNTLRNFVLSLRTNVDPKNGDYSLQELCDTISHQMKARLTKQYMAGQIASNVLPQQSTLLSLAPLFLKRPVMASFYHKRGEKPETVGISNLGVVDFPEEIKPYVNRVNFVTGVQVINHHNCSVVAYEDKMLINITRNIEESEVERLFFTKLVELGLNVTIECNREG